MFLGRVGKPFREVREALKGVEESFLIGADQERRWGELIKKAQDRDQWRALVSGLYPDQG